MKKTLLILLVGTLASNAYGAELFGVKLATATRDQLRSAVKKSGVKLLQEAGVDSFYDVYQGSSVLHRADHLYLGFVKKDNKFAFAEYEFSGLKQPVLLKKLNGKYGVAQISAGKFISDQTYSWVSDGVNISFYYDWKLYKTRLVYFNSEALKRLRNEKKLYDISASQSLAAYQQLAY